MGRLLVKMAAPAVVAQLINMLYNLVDRIYIGHIPGEGAYALTGMGVCMPVIMIVSAFAMLAGAGGAPRASIAMGRGDNEAAEQALGNCFCLLLIVSAVLTGVLLVFNRPILKPSVPPKTPSAMPPPTWTSTRWALCSCS